MRSVIVYLRDTTRADVEAYLNATYPTRGSGWVRVVDSDPCLYIDFYGDSPDEYEPEDWAEIVRQLSGEPDVAVIADISGRHPGLKEVRAFVDGLLTRFRGGVHDDYTFHLWSLAELEAGILPDGHPFFDYRGRYEKERESRAVSESR